jgi:outer membrane protein TolC
MKIIIASLLITLCNFSWSQDTLQQLNLENFLSHIKENHPIAVVASNDILRSEQIIRMSKGAFDPLLIGGIDQKFYDGKTYYSTLNTGVKIPTRLGWNLNVMGDWNNGEFLNPENRVPAEGLTYLGIEVPLGRGMFTDEQRTQLKRAMVANEKSLTERQLVLNDLLYEAGIHFINWQEQEGLLILAQEIYELAEIRLNQVKTNAELGDRPDIDTTEASAQLYLRKMDLDQRLLNVKNARLQIENYMWEKGVIPLVLESTVSATAITLILPDGINPKDELDFHPVLTFYDLKMRDLQLERKLKVEQLKPQFNINYNLLQTPKNIVSTNYSFTYYKWGASFYMPILLRKERSSLAITKLKLENTLLEMNHKKRDLETKQLQIRNEWNTNLLLAESSRIVAESYKQLSSAERSLYELGESSLFLINAREMSYFMVQGKYIEYLSKTNKSALSEKFILGILGK